MKTLIATLLTLFVISSCQEEEQTLDGRYNFIEPPHPVSRTNRLDNSDAAFDVIFTINGNTLTEVDMVLSAQEVTGETGSIQGKDIIIFEGAGAMITIKGAKKLGNTIQASGAEFTANGQTKTYGALQIDPY